MSDPSRVRLYLSSEHPCGYLAGRPARNAYLDPEFTPDRSRYAFLLSQGFRRSGIYVYKPHCAGCTACVPARIPVQQLQLSRTQRRCLNRNQDVVVSVRRQLTDEHFGLYGRYLNARHTDGGMTGDNREAFHSFLECAWNPPEYWEFRCGEKLLAVAVVDVVANALSAVYTFFDPDESARSLGTLAILHQTLEARRRDLAFLYLGYWVAESPKMAYKQNFRPLEILTPDGWTPQR